jgi:predicted RNase H-like HicB family nuclease
MKESIMRFPVVLHTDDGRHYGVTVPDLPGCFSGGEGIEDALASAMEAIDLHLEGMVEEGLALPAAGSLVAHQANPEFAGGVWVLVTVDLSRYEGKAEKINITLPRYLIRRIDEAARAAGSSRSRFLADAARKAMQSPRAG